MSSRASQSITWTTAFQEASSATGSSSWLRLSSTPNMKRVAVVPNKGSAGKYAKKMLLELMEECGDKGRGVVVKTDQEPGIRILVDDTCVGRTSARTIPEMAPKGSKGSNVPRHAEMQTEQNAQVENPEEFGMM